VAEVAEEQEQWEARIEAAPRELAVQEALLAELGHLFHPGHNLATDVMFNLLPLFGARGSGSTADQEKMVTEAERKEKICDTLLETMQLVIPGQFRMRGMLLVERHTTKLFLLRAALDGGRSSKSQFIRRMASLRSPLVEALGILGREPAGSLEASRLQHAQKYLVHLDSLVENAGKTLLPASAE
jgi:hypothetical protein